MPYRLHLHTSMCTPLHHCTGGIRHTISESAFTLAWVGVRACTAGPALQAHTECSHMNKEEVFTLVRAAALARMPRKTC